MFLISWSTKMKGMYDFRFRIYHTRDNMFGIGKTSKTALAKKIIIQSIEASDQFFDYLKEDSYLYSKCITQTPIKNTGTLFMINLYRDILNSKYDSKDVYGVIRFSILSLGSSKSMEDILWRSFLDYMNSCNEALEYYSHFSNFDPIDVFTKVYFSLVIDDRKYLQDELENSISRSVSYRKIYDFIYGFFKHQTLLDENYNLKLL